VAWRVEPRRPVDPGARLVLFQAATAALAGARTPDEVADAALKAGIAALGGDCGAVLVPDPGGGLRAVRAAGVTDAAALDEAAAGWVAPAEGGASAPPRVDEEGGSGGDAALAAVRGALGAYAVVALPLAFERRFLGALVVGFDAPDRLAAADGELAAGVAAQCAHALERARLFVAERLARAEAVAAHGRLAFLDALSAHLAESEGEEELLAGVARLAVPALGDWAGIYATAEGRGEARVAESGAAALGGAVEAHLRAAPVGPFASACRCEGGVVTVDDLPEEAGGARPVAAVAPLCVKGRSLGAVVVASADRARRGGLADVALLAEVARRTALALEHGRLLRDATAAAQAREDFLHVASHELRSPLGILRLSVDLLARDLARGGGGAEARLRTIVRQSDRLARLSETLLDVTRITGGRLELAREEGDLAALAREVVGRAAEEAPGLAVAVDAPEPVRCLYDPARMDQVLTNLLSNAIKYGGGRPVRVAVRREGTTAVVEVEDRGIGIARDVQDRIFGRFERAVSGREYGGLGLGLWIVRRIVEAHGGTVRLSSEPARGSTFGVVLPAAP
jgi:signal transduction histidine kinase